MKLLHLLALLVLLMPLLHSNVTASSTHLSSMNKEEGYGHNNIANPLSVEKEEGDDFEDDNTLSGDDGESDDDFLGPAVFSGRVLTSERLTCNHFPKICRLKGSPGRHCCKKKCVNLSGDRRNCGKCGRKCKYGFICCKGKCVNPNVSRSHCGGCNNRCKNGGFCAFGLCNYA